MLPEETPKYEFKVGDKVKIHLAGNRYDNWIATVAYIHRDLIGVTVNNHPFVYHSEHIELVESYEEKHEFKPFDKVLVRDLDTSEWRPRLYSRKGRVGYCMQDGCEYMQILPYEGNEHLVGTTNNPE